MHTKRQIQREYINMGTFFASDAMVDDQRIDVINRCKNEKKSYMYTIGLEYYIVVEYFIWDTKLYRIGMSLLCGYYCYIKLNNIFHESQKNAYIVFEN